MHFSAGIHPSQTFPANQDAFRCWESSLASNSAESGCISPLEFIPARHFLLIRMIFSAGIHPPQTFLANQDKSPRQKSSLQDISIKSGCISPLEFIPTRHFLLIRMIFSAGIHPYKTFPANQDAFPRWNSSLQELFNKSGWFSPPEFIPTRHFLLIRMIFSAGIHPYKTFLANQDDFLRRNSSLQDISC